MKLRNKKTGEIFDYRPTLQKWNGPLVTGCHYNSLAELNEDWEDYEGEPCFISEFGKVHPISCMGGDKQRVKWLKEIGNYFETEGEAKKAVKKLEAYKRLKDNGWEFTGWDRHPDFFGDFRITASDQSSCDDKDLDLLFGGEDE